MHLRGFRVLTQCALNAESTRCVRDAYSLRSRCQCLFTACTVRTRVACSGCVLGMHARVAYLGADSGCVLGVRSMGAYSQCALWVEGHENTDLSNSIAFSSMESQIDARMESQIDARLRTLSAASTPVVQHSASSSSAEAEHIGTHVVASPPPCRSVCGDSGGSSQSIR